MSASIHKEMMAALHYGMGKNHRPPVCVGPPSVMGPSVPGCWEATHIASRLVVRAADQRSFDAMLNELLDHEESLA